MPTDTVTTFHCNACEQNHPQSAMSLFEGYCAECFKRYMVLCVNCGMLLTRPNTHRMSDTPRPLSYTLCRACFTDGDMLCPDCCCTQSPSCTQWRPKPLNTSIATYARMKSRRKFGVEIETSYCPCNEQLRSISPFGCKTDPTVNGMEFDSPILYGDEGLTHIEEMLDFASDNGWRVDGDCGCHTHYDMRDESDESLWRIFYAYRLTGPVWEACVPPERVSGEYSGAMSVSARTIRRNYETDSVSFEDFCGHRERYDYLNVYSYLDHKTFELRMLEGSLDAETICNWIILHCRFIDKVKELSFPRLRSLFANKATQGRFTALAELIDDRELMTWLSDRANRETNTHFYRLPVVAPVDLLV